MPGRASAIVTNSGCANACTGPQGMIDAKEMAQLTATAIGCREDHVLVASTGVIGVNLKMDKIRSGVPQAVAALAPQGRLAIITFHSGEDRIVKHYFQSLIGREITLVTTKPVVATEEEIKNNPRARSAKLRVVEKI